MQRLVLNDFLEIEELSSIDLRLYILENKFGFLHIDALETECQEIDKDAEYF